MFDSPEDAEQAQQKLERQFAAQVAGSITTVVVPYDDNDPAGSVSAGNQALRRAKVAGRPAEPVWHLPVQALCASCGVELATQYRSGHPDDPAQYICETCYRKASVDWFGLFDELRSDIAQLFDVNRISLPNNAAEADTYAWDPRNYVAYLLADGNHMGKLFGCCRDRQALDTLSKGVTQATTWALADAVHGMLADQHPSWDRYEMPCLPLIMGGDDLFVLLPAPWAYDVAARFCTAYEDQLQPVVDDLYTHRRLVDSAQPDQTPRATTGVATVICKANYPYKLAHQHGDSILEEVKDHAKRANRSMLAVDLITGSETTGNAYRPTPQILSPQDVQQLLTWRFGLKDIASRTLERLRLLLASGSERDLNIWLKRIEQVSANSHILITDARAELGDGCLLELLNHWDFAHDLTKKPEDYAMGRVEA